MTQARYRNLIAVAAAFGLVGAGAALRGGGSTAHATPSIPTDGSIADTAERVFESVVDVSITMAPQAIETNFDPFMGGQQDEAPMHERAEGSGVIVTASGRILTNAHVVNNAQTIKVTLNDGTKLDAKVIGKDSHADLAVLQLQGNVPALKPIAFGDSSTMRLGDIVLAVGNGLGVGKSVSMGIISAKGRTHVGIEDYENFIQTDAAINQGNSGGALVNLKGELIGVNTAIASKSGGYSGVGFAIPSDMARPIMEALIKDGKVTRGYLGVNVITVTPDLAREAKLGASAGVAVAGVQPRGPGQLAGLAEGDVITSIAGVDTKDDGTLRDTVANQKPGTTVDVALIHQNGAKQTIKVRLGALPDETSAERMNRQQQELQQGQRQQMQQHMQHRVLPNGAQQWQWQSP
jgi:serine protease Do